MAEVDGPWLANRPKCLVPKHPDDSSPEVCVCSPFILPSLYRMRDPHDIILRHHDHLLEFSSGKTTAHAHWSCHGSSVHLPASMLEPQILQKLQTSLSPFKSLFHACDTLPQVFRCTLIPDSNLLTFLKTQA